MRCRQLLRSIVFILLIVFVLLGFAYQFVQADGCVSSGPKNALLGGLEIDSYEELELALENEYKKNPLTFSSLSVGAAKTIRDTGDEVLWTSMARQGNMPFVSLAGCYSAIENSTESSHEIAILCLIHASDIASVLYSPVKEYLSNEDWSFSDIDFFAERLENIRYQHNIAYIMGLIPAQDLVGWIENDLLENDLVSPAQYSEEFYFYMIDHFYDIKDEIEQNQFQKIDPIFQSYLKKVSSLPGESTLLYALYYRGDDMDVEKAVARALKDKAISDTQCHILLRSRRDVVEYLMDNIIQFDEAKQKIIKEYAVD